MKFRNLAVVIAALFLVAACESTSTESGKSSGDGKQMAKKQVPDYRVMAKKKGNGKGKRKGSPKGFSITPGSSQDLVVNVGDRVFFAFDKSNLSSAARGTLEKQAAWLKKYGSVKITIEGHADERGTREYNLALGERRANSAKDFLVALGISPNRVKTISYGKERPVALGHDESSWSQNRRGVTTVSGAGS
ncbi:MAG: peptidoglycan-associated lipoprotein Pal [Rhodospirillales bacterium]|jgi:peptidoglycan-associated lipoprotein|nr:peptidoglycan-associated lipoprotein Pal [Rhodospirillales bacterium]